MDQVNRNRLEEFRQLRQEVRHSEEYLIVGIDIAKGRHYAFFGTATGKILLERFVFSNDHEGFSKLLDYAEDLRGLLSLKKRLKKQEHGYLVRIRNHLITQYFPGIRGIAVLKAMSAAP